MIWRLENFPHQCNDGRTLLVFNEPEYKGQANLTPLQAIEHLRKFRDWIGPVYGCGTAWFSDGWNWFQEFIRIAGNDLDILDGIHFHCYSDANAMDLHDDYAQRWADLASDYEWPIIISEWGIQNANDSHRDIFLDYLTRIFSPIAMFMFSWKYHLIPTLDMVDSSGELTEIGRWWFSRLYKPNHVFLPVIRKGLNDGRRRTTHRKR